VQFSAVTVLRQISVGGVPRRVVSVFSAQVKSLRRKSVTAALTGEPTP
jgi:hypothetical protein